MEAIFSPLSVNICGLGGEKKEGEGEGGEGEETNKTVGGFEVTVNDFRGKTMEETDGLCNVFGHFHARRPRNLVASVV